MPPRRSARVAAAAERVAARVGPASTLSALPLAVMLLIFSMLPVDTRLRCREVCRAWRAALEDRSMWWRLDLREGSVTGFDDRDFPARRPAWAALLHAAATRAGGDLRVLLTGGEEFTYLELDDITRVAALNAGALRVLRVTELHEGLIVPLLNAAPHLEALEADMMCFGCVSAHQILRNLAPYLRPDAHVASAHISAT